MAKPGRTRKAPEDFNQRTVERVFSLIKLMKQTPHRTRQDLVQILEISERTLYRYMNLLETLGFVLLRDAHGNYYIAGSDVKESFTQEEADFLGAILKENYASHELSVRVLRKLHMFHTEDQLVGEDLLAASRAQNLARISEGIKQRRRVLLLGYHSAHSQTSSNRLVEPIEFLAGHSTLSALEVESLKVKYFRLDRIAGVELSSSPMELMHHHRTTLPDMFGFALEEGADAQEIHLELSIRDALFMRSEFPLSAAYLRPTSDGERFQLRGPVADFRPIGRFIRGLENRSLVRVLGDAAFLKFYEVEVALEKGGFAASSWEK